MENMKKEAIDLVIITLWGFVEQREPASGNWNF